MFVQHSVIQDMFKYLFAYSWQKEVPSFMENEQVLI
jgi:hypothetical protein